ncbi:hypothetical protein G6F31_018119 [Rhizopus arrhizus]|nr:hypothetical protein G6F31_018119 [Rhizopus arrhizus]
MHFRFHRHLSAPGFSAFLVRPDPVRARLPPPLRGACRPAPVRQAAPPARAAMDVRLHRRAAGAVSGDTLTQIARKQGTSVSNLVRWNGLSNSNTIEVGQMLRVQAPGGQTSTSGSGKAQSKPATSSPRTSTSTAKRRTAPPGALALVWPAQGPVTRG